MDERSASVDGIPVTYVLPDGPPGGVALWLSHLGGSAAQTVPMLHRLAGFGYAAVSFDAPEHGSRSTGDPWAFATDLLGAFRRRMWPLLGLTTLEALRVLDWADDTLEAGAPRVAGGVSMGGDVAIALAGADSRISRVATVMSTPDWSRPAMARLDDPDRLLDQGEADAYAEWFYDRLDPRRHADRYRGVALHFQNGGADRHIPVDDAYAFRDMLRARFPGDATEIVVEVIPDATHRDISDAMYDAAAAWLTAQP